MIVCLSLDESGIDWLFIKGVAIGFYNILAYETYFVLIAKRPKIYQNYLEEKNTMRDVKV